MFGLNAFGRVGAVVRSAFAADPDAAIKALFASGEQGLWYDPSDLTTMFQDRAGTTPVTADGQAVGMILDKSKGLVLGSELVTNGTFDSNVAGWTPHNASTLSIVGGKLRVTSTGTGDAGVYQQVLGLTVGKTYKISYFCDPGTMGDCYVDPVQAVLHTVAGTYEGYFVASGTSVALYARTAGAAAAGTYIEFDNISLKELAGNHATAPSDAARPLKTSTGLSDWINYDAVDDVLNSTFPSSLGSSCTVCRANVGAAPTILTAQTIGTSYADSTDHAGLIIINRALTGQETTDVTAWLTAKGATA